MRAIVEVKPEYFVRTATYSNAAPLIVQLNLRRTAITKSPGQTGTGAKFVLGLEQVAPIQPECSAGVNRAHRGYGIGLPETEPRCGKMR